ncbi:TrbC/VirB2 family protein [bacterium]|nr:TrbC/VirB2 family protein [bacterium]MBR2274239.1 TrbC/VirB2 family protein [Alphaproteobacteria bacterium]
MFGLTKIETYIFLAALIVVICMPTDCFAAFETLKETGGNIFRGLRKIIYPASAIGVICVCIGGFFGNINWKWLTAVVVGLIVITLCSGFIEMFAATNIHLDQTDTLNGG